MASFLYLLIICFSSTTMMADFEPMELLLATLLLLVTVNPKLAQKSVPIPTNKSEKMILKIAKINNGIITANLDS